MKTITFFILCILTSGFWPLTSGQVQTNTNELHLDFLVCSNKTYEDCTIIRVTPAYAVVSYSGCLEKVPLAVLPDSLKQKYGYDQKKADAFLKSEKQNLAMKKAAALAAQAADEKFIASLAGTNRVIRITSIEGGVGVLKCSAAIDGQVQPIMIRNLPDSVKNFVIQYNQLRNDILTFGEKIHNDALAAKRADASAPIGAAGDAAYVNSVMAQRDRANQMAVNVEDEADRLKQMQDDLEKMASDSVEKTSIYAYPTGQNYAGLSIWQCAQN
jgi:hypothetical protein